MKKFLDKVLVAVFVSIWAFVLIMVATFYIKGEVPDELIVGFFSVFGGEGVLCAVITVAKKIVGKKTDEEGDEEDELE